MRWHACGMQDWAPVAAVSISAPVGAAAALAGAWLQGRLSRQAAAEADERRFAQDHAKAVGATVSNLLAVLDIAAQATSQLIDPLTVITGGKYNEVTGNFETGLDQETSYDLLNFARTAFTDILSRMNDVRILESKILSEATMEKIRTIVLQFNHKISFGLVRKKGSEGGSLVSGIHLKQIDEIYSLHSKITNAYNSWSKATD